MFTQTSLRHLTSSKRTVIEPNPPAVSFIIMNALFSFIQTVCECECVCVCVNSSVSLTETLINYLQVCVRAHRANAAMIPDMLVDVCILLLRPSIY